jgi:hypothetical protein
LLVKGEEVQRQVPVELVVDQAGRPPVAEVKAAAGVGGDRRR